jgi:hypothetical protein
MLKPILDRNDLAMKVVHTTYTRLSLTSGGLTSWDAEAVAQVGSAIFDF